MAKTKVEVREVQATCKRCGDQLHVCHIFSTEEKGTSIATACLRCDQKDGLVTYTKLDKAIR